MCLSSQSHPATRSALLALLVHVDLPVSGDRPVQLALKALRVRLVHRGLADPQGLLVRKVHLGRRLTRRLCAPSTCGWMPILIKSGVLPAVRGRRVLQGHEGQQGPVVSPDPQAQLALLGL